MVDAPAAMPDTIPVEPMVATAVLLLLQVPPASVLARAVVLPTHTLVVPVMVAGRDMMLTVVVIAQPVLMV